jgi:hypothetical protein
MSKDWRTIVRFAFMGAAITAVCVAYQVLTDSSPPSPRDMPLLLIFMILCPGSFLTIPLIDIETGTGGFYVLWTFVALIDAALYALVGAAYVGLRKKPEGDTTS